MAWLNFTMPNQTVKDGLQAKKIKLPQMNFFPQKTTNKIFMYLLSLSFCKIFKKILRLFQSYENVPFSGTKWLICHEQNFFGANNYYYFHLLIGPFHRIQSYEDASSLGPKSSFAPNKFFFKNNYWYHFELPIGPFHSAKFLKNS